MRCSTSSDHFDIGRVLIYLIEPETCSYVLVLESGLFCDGLQEVDGYGLMEKMPALEASEIEHESREVSASESPSFSMSYTDAERQMEGSEPQQQQPEEGEAQRKVRIVRIDKAELRRALRQPGGVDEDDENDESGENPTGADTDAILDMVKSLLPPPPKDDTKKEKSGHHRKDPTVGMQPDDGQVEEDEEERHGEL